MGFPGRVTFWPFTADADLPQLASNDLLLRLPQIGDYEDWQDLRRRSAPFLKPFEPRWTEADLARSVYTDRVRRARQEARQGSDFTFFLFRTATGRQVLVGGLTLSNVRRRAAQFVNLGYWMGEDYAGRGLMSEAVRLVVPFVFNRLELHRIHAAFLPHNAASRRVLEKNGFIEEGFARHYLQINGRWEDHVLFGLSRERYEAFLAGRVLGV